MTKPEPVEAWAVLIDENEAIRPDYVFSKAHKKSELSNEYHGCRVIPVRIVPEVE